MVVYEEVHNMVVRVANDLNTYKEDLEDYDNAVKGARWLFDLRIAEEIDLLRKSAIEYSRLSINHSRELAPPPKSFTEQVEAMLRNNTDVKEVVVLDALFDPFMRVGSLGIKAWLRNWFGKRQKQAATHTGK